MSHTVNNYSHILILESEINYWLCKKQRCDIDSRFAICFDAANCHSKCSAGSKNRGSNRTADKQNK